jgi:hypothetical protein
MVQSSTALACEPHGYYYCPLLGVLGATLCDDLLCVAPEVRVRAEWAQDMLSALPTPTTV